MKKKLIPLTASPRFVKFTRQRDAGLERVLAKYSVQVTAVLDTLKRDSCAISAHMHAIGASTAMLKRTVEAFEHRLKPLFQRGAERTAGLILSLRRTTLVISAAGQGYAIQRALSSDTKPSVTRKHIADHKAKEMMLGGNVHARVDLAFTRLLHSVVDAFQMSQVMGSTPAETIERIERAFPKTVKHKRPKRVMARMTEAGRDPRFNSGEFYTPDEWDEAVADYLDDEVPLGRAPYDKVFYSEASGDSIETYERYQWQVEAEMTDDFVDSVRDGENYAANAQGVNDFEFIAIIDSHTDECCYQCDGLSITEIQAKIDSGEFEPSQIGLKVCPRHPFCRCRLAPMTTTMPEESGPDWGEFDDWLYEKGGAA